jgi:nickel-dependent lactate racemase
MNIMLPYGRQHIRCTISDSTHLLVPSVPRTTGLKDFTSTLLSLLFLPSTGISLETILSRKSDPSIAIIVNDATRSTPTKKVLDVILPFLIQHGIRSDRITIVIATGTHRAPTYDELGSIVGEDVLHKFRIISHDCDSDDLIPVGILSTGIPLRLNAVVVNADIRISIGEILYHYHAGFSGGRKSLFPGVADRESIYKNHSRMLHPQSKMGQLTGNPVHEELMDSLRLCPLDFSIHLIGNSNQEICDIVAGDPIMSWKKGIDIFLQWNQILLPQKVDLLIVSAGGYPKDINMYQAHKALEMSSRAVKNGGEILFIAECSEKWGHSEFEKQAHRQLSVGKISEEIHHQFLFGLHKLYYLANLSKQYHIFLFSTFSEEETILLFMKKIQSIQDFVSQKSGVKSICVLPHGSIGLQIIQK